MRRIALIPAIVGTVACGDRLTEPVLKPPFPSELAPAFAVVARTELMKLIAPDGAEEDWFGNSVAVSGDVAVVGAYEDDDRGEGSGSVYVFGHTRDGWTQEAKLLALDGAANNRFGNSVAVSGNVAVIGAFTDDDNGTDSGSAYVFRRAGDAWTQEAKLLASDGAVNDVFGNSVAVSGDLAVIAARGDDDNGEASGSAYVFRHGGNGWVEEAKLVASDGAAYDIFGSSVAVSGNVAVVGAHFDDDKGYGSGSAYVFRHGAGGWTEELKLLASDGAAHDYFGDCVSVSGDVAVVGAQEDDDNGFASGSAYVFDVDEVWDTRVTVCHHWDDKGWKQLSVSEGDVQDHLDHGDGLVGDPVPGMPGFAFDESCVPVEVVGGE